MLINRLSLSCLYYPLFRAIWAKQINLHERSTSGSEVKTSWPLTQTTRRWSSVDLMLVQRLRRWTNIRSTLDQRLVFAGYHLWIRTSRPLTSLKQYDRDTLPGHVVLRIPPCFTHSNLIVVYHEKLVSCNPTQSLWQTVISGRIDRVRGVHDVGVAAAVATETCTPLSSAQACRRLDASEIAIFLYAKRVFVKRRSPPVTFSRGCCQLHQQSENFNLWC